MTRRTFSPPRGQGRRFNVVAPALVVPAVVALVLAFPLVRADGRPEAASGSKRSQRAKTSDSTKVPQPVVPAFVPGKPTFLRSARDTTRWAVVRTPVVARVGPRADAPAVTRIETQTPEGTTNLVVVLGSRVDSLGRLWIRARLPSLGEETAGWIPRSALGGSRTVTTRLVVDLDSFEATLFRAGRPIFRADVGVGKPSWPTPRGEFYVRNKLTGYASPAYGPLAFGTSARSSVLTDWPAGGFVGIHGTDQPNLLPGRVSHGCIRMRNDDIVRLSELMPVGTPLTIR